MSIVLSFECREAENFTHQVVDLIQEVVDFLAVRQPDVALAQHPAHLAPRLVLTDAHHDHEANHVVQQDGEQTILVVLQPLLLRVSQRVVPASPNPHTCSSFRREMTQNTFSPIW